MEHPRRLVHSTEIPIRWGDMDAQGHVNNTVYFRYAEQGRIEWLASLGLLERGSGGSPVVVNASCSFLIPFVFPGTVELRTYLANPGRSSVASYYEMRLAGDDRLYAEGAAKIVWTDAVTGKSMALPEALRSLAE